MTQARWWTFVAVMALILVGSGSRAGVPNNTKPRAPATKKKTKKSSVILKTYSASGLTLALCGDSVAGGDVLTQTIIKIVSPKSWSPNGGSGTIDYYPLSDTLVIRQTSAVHKQVSSLLKGLTAVQPQRETAVQPQRETAVQPQRETAAAPVAQALYTTGSTASGASPAKTPLADNARQYGHFVLDNLRVNAMGVSCTVKRLRFQYRGDGLDNDVAKCALGKDPEKKTIELPKAVTDLLEKMAEKATESPKVTPYGQCHTLPSGTTSGAAPVGDPLTGGIDYAPVSAVPPRQQTCTCTCTPAEEPKTGSKGKKSKEMPASPAIASPCSPPPSSPASASPCSPPPSISGCPFQFSTGFSR